MFVSSTEVRHGFTTRDCFAPDAGGAVGTANSIAPTILVVSPRSPLGIFLVGNNASLPTYYCDWASDPYVAFAGRSVVKISPLH